MVWQGKYDSLFINGQWEDPSSGDVLSVVSPTTEQVIATVPSGSAEDMDRAVAAARTAFDGGSWSRMSVDGRIAVLRAASDLFQQCEELIAETVSAEMGCPITLARTMQSRNPRIFLDTMVDVAESFPWNAVRRSGIGQALVTRNPVGVVAAVVPWNVPVLATMIKIVPALLAGCTVVLKPSPEAPLSSYLVAEIFQEAGLPDGVLNVVPADREASEHLVSHPGVDKVSFTGSTAAGRRIAAVCGNDLRRVTLELGGKSAALILDDADMDLVVENVRNLSLRNSGQTCSNKTRILVPRERENDLHDRLVAMVESMPVGDPADPATQIGPMVTQAHRRRVEGYVDAGRRDGATVLIGGGRPAELGKGWYVEPTIFTDVQQSMQIVQEEIFGPVLTVQGYTDVDEAIALANGTDFGLSGSVFSVDEERAVGVALRIHTGAVEVNGAPVGWRAPVGGVRASGIGREAGPEGLEAYVEAKSIGISAELADRLS
ncbi:aldehyde dehydrogenase [Gordonia hydrophobica]|uniref:aldehyde dehydrogenase (NAD(+)) n=1 Tax=Gordonia hydrophobica TaxID=40516 RepID=A0ABZ2UB29_9ACTN|nr:aldehyde dehydrogenase [Gordonia hydrophobica]MBM7365409.1 acyl-CoA reductase-like NAD-dependent aldehyde dehydrogenase [Gordonia hydrophobica]